MYLLIHKYDILLPVFIDFNAKSTDKIKYCNECNSLELYNFNLT